MQALDGVGGVNDFADFLRIGEKRNDLLPHSAPALGDGRNLFTQSSSLKILQAFGGHFGRLRAVDGLELGSNRLALCPIAERQGSAAQMRNARLNLTIRSNRSYRFGAGC